jgi:two-component system CheB/CheR fusion protein
MPSPKDVAVVSPEPGRTDEVPLPLAQRNQELEHEHSMTKEYLQATIEERESTLEELQSANEELQSSNEELQSTNEELETSKEEMQSTNEEPTTVNDELQSRMTELSQTNDDLHNVLAGVDNAVIIVGLDLRIRRYTVAAERLFNLIPADLGRTIGFLDPFFAFASGSSSTAGEREAPRGAGALAAKVSAVIQSLASLEEEVLASNHRWYALRITPYKTLDHAIRGALLTLTDIDVRRRATEITRDVGAYADRFLAPIGHPLLILDRKLRVVWCNEPFLATFQLAREETIGSMLPSLGARQLAEPGLRDRLESLLATGAAFRDHRLRYRSGEAGEHVFRISGSQVPASGETSLVLLSIEPAPAPPPGGAST